MKLPFPELTIRITAKQQIGKRLGFPIDSTNIRNNI